MTETITSPAPIVPTLDDLLAWAEAEQLKKDKGQPSEWDQGHWAINVPAYNAYWGVRKAVPAVNCGTACCLAGKTVAFMGGKFLIEADSDGTAVEAEMPDGTTVFVEGFAEQVLGLTTAQADALFDGDNTIENVRFVIEQIKDGVEYPDRFPNESYDDEDDA